MKSTLISASVFWALVTAMPAFAQTDTGTAPGAVETPAEDVAPAEPAAANPAEPAPPAELPVVSPAPQAPPERRGGGLAEGVSPVLTEFAKKAILSGDGSFTYEHVKKAETPTGKGIPETNTFAMAGFRLKLDGEITDRLGYRIQLDFFGYKFKPLAFFEGFATYEILRPELKVYVGQIKPMSLGDGVPRYWQFIKPGNAADTLKWDEPDRGVTVRGKLWGERLQYEAQLLNGNGILDDTKTKNDNTAFRGGLLVRVEPLGAMSLFANDRDRSPFRVGVGLGAAYSRDRDTAVVFQDRRWLTASVYAKAHGLFIKALFSQLDLTRDAGTIKNERYGSVQAGYAVPVWYDHVVEPVARYTYTDPNTKAGGDKQQWVTVGCNYYLYGQLAKLQVNYIFKSEQVGAELDNDTLQLAAFVLF